MSTTNTLQKGKVLMIESYKIIKRTATGRTLYLVSGDAEAKKAGELNPKPSSNVVPDLAWSKAGYHLIRDRIAIQVETKDLAVLLSASWARTGFARTLEPGDRVYALKGQGRALVLTVAERGIYGQSMIIAKKFR